MRIGDMTDNLFDREMQKLLADVQFWTIRLGAIQPDFRLEPTPVSYMDGTGKQPFPLALELKRCWDYARGAGPKPEEMQEIIQELCELLWCPVAGTSYDIPAAWWDTPLGQMVLMCWARAKLDAGQNMIPEDLALLAGVTPRWIRDKCRNGDIIAEKVKREGSSQEEWAIPAEEARKFLAGRDSSAY